MCISIIEGGTQSQEDMNSKLLRFLEDTTAHAVTLLFLRYSFPLVAHPDHAHSSRAGVKPQHVRLCM